MLAPLEAPIIEHLLQIASRKVIARCEIQNYLPVVPVVLLSTEASKNVGRIGRILKPYY